ncbi:squalene epoxidase [Coniophora puteana RWD-64-598 SS2]|uniref:Squalene monooxygenase n=1 Tax=Coniophora puteana (strain RWD-64-598) TaxID=741705 RepID=A0A5M3N4X7_CONPW|nr:squalene epoxidase [Coniophora puteana RWD-64-598 SS2]EIW85971.1 squalene epoxidase [Coniophora puteana RWD-64-598 SS2]
MVQKHYDVVIVGAGIAGATLAYALSTITSKTRPAPLSIALLERSLAEPDRIVGELLQPSGVASLQAIGMEQCLEGIDAIPVQGYCVAKSGELVHIPYPDAREGRSFHHGKFVQSLRAKARQGPGVETIEATVTDLVECEHTGRVIGVRARPANQASRDGGEEGTAEEKGKGDEEKDAYFADLVVIADGCFSNFRTSVMRAARKSSTRSHFVGVVLNDAHLPMPHHGTVCLVKGHGPVLLYQIGEHDTRMLVDIKAPLPSNLKAHILHEIVPSLPSSLHVPIHEALERDRLRRMPNSFLPSVEQGHSSSKEGVILIGDAWNMRHPLTGGGMTVALNDVVILSRMLGGTLDYKNWDRMSDMLHQWHWARKPLSATVNILSVALYDLFGADEEALAVLQRGCFKYFECGGDCVRGPVSLLSGIAPSPSLLAYHFFSVAFYAIWVMFTHPRPVGASSLEKPVLVAPSVLEYPGLFLKSFQVFWTACIVFGPLLWTEIRWW